ncbi:ABC transporter permease [Angustibacter sp. McL0619]|uniref:ABC transporter permease n=1 Tax=Angustibacter sp. McL0619 TaxID=3415676 RepID=UPI003CF39D70
MTIASQSVEQEAHVSGGEGGVQGRSPSQIAWGRLKRDKVGMVSLVVVIMYVVIALLAPVITRMLGVDVSYHTELIGDGGLPKGSSLANAAISLQHLLGIEPETGRDILAELLYGSRISLLVAFSATLLTCVIGVTLGIIAGYSGGWIDTALGRTMDLILSIPQLVLLISLSPLVLQSLDQRFGVDGNTARLIFLILVFGIFGWPYLARIIRGQVLSLREREFVEAAISTGASTRRILFKEVLPNLWVPILVYSSLLLPSYISAEAALSFLGVGVTEPTPTWGNMLSNSVKYYQVAPLYLFIPGTALFLLVLAFNLLGDSIRDALDPRAGRS